MRTLAFTVLILIMAGAARADALQQAEKLIVSGKGAEARALLEKLPGAKTDSRIVVRIARSYLCFPPTEPDEAMKILKAFLKANPKSVEGLLEWARTLREVRDYPNAIKTYDIVLKSNPKDFLALYGKVETYLAMAKFKEADETAQAALALDEKRPESHYMLAKVHERRNDVPGTKINAVAGYEKAVELSGSDTRYYGPLLFAQTIYGAGGVRDTLEKLKRVAPGDANVAFGEGLLLDGEDRMKEALAKYQGAVAVDYGHTFAHFALGVLYSGRTMTGLFAGKRLIGRKPPSFAGFANPMHANQEFAVVRFQDPTFPYMSLIDAYQSISQPVEPAQPTPEQAAQDKAWNNYWLLLQLRH
jgi:tetratricopeptide (TPR) repeat protein